MSEATALQTFNDQSVSYTPFGERDEITLKVGQVRNFIAIRTKSGKQPSDGELIKFLMLCKARELNPWAGDAFLCGYDGKDGPQFSLITAHQALLKRAEACPGYGGMESGVIVLAAGDEVVERVGSLQHNGDTLIGGWAAVHRSDRSVPQRNTVPLAVYNTGRSRWAKDPGGMIQKVAEASCLRRAFPTQLGALYCGEEMEHVTGGPRAAEPAGAKVARSAVNDLLEGDEIEGEVVAAEVSPTANEEPPADYDFGDQSEALFEKAPSAAEE